MREGERERQREVEALREVDEERERERRRRVQDAEGMNQRVGNVGKGRSERESAPYPVDNRIPTEEDVVGRGRQRGANKPNTNEVVGLGVRLG